MLPTVFLALIATGCAPGTGGDPSPLVGKAAPDFSIPILSGGTQTLSSQKGKVVLLDFWATWCPPCVASLPHIQKTATDSELAGRGLVVWAVNQAEDTKTIQDFLNQNHYTITVLKDDGAAGSHYVSDGIPTTVIIGRDGTVRKVYVGFPQSPSDQATFIEEEDAAIKQALDEPATKSPA